VAGPHPGDADVEYDEPGFDDGAGDAKPAPSLRRTVGLLALVTVGVAAGLTALLLMLTRPDSAAQSPTVADKSHPVGTHHRGGSPGPGSQNPPTRTSSTHPSPHPSGSPSTSPAASSPTAQTSAPTPTAPTTAAGGPVPAGYQLVRDPLGFQVAIPRGWTRRAAGGSRVDYVSPTTSAMYLRVDQVPQAAPSAVQAWREYEPTLAKQLPGYHRIRLQRVPFRQWKAADLEFTWQSTNTTLHVLDRGFITDPRGFALLMSGPDDTWQSESLPVFNVAASTFSPTP
jgi:eukaryotic-like serine/threonine-protein kinase